MKVWSDTLLPKSNVAPAIQPTRVEKDIVHKRRKKIQTSEASGGSANAMEIKPDETSPGEKVVTSSRKSDFPSRSKSPRLHVDSQHGSTSTDVKVVDDELSINIDNAGKSTASHQPPRQSSQEQMSSALPHPVVETSGHSPEIFPALGQILHQSEIGSLVKAGLKYFEK